MPHAGEPVSGETRGAPQDDGVLKTAREAVARTFEKRGWDQAAQSCREGKYDDSEEILHSRRAIALDRAARPSPSAASPGPDEVLRYALKPFADAAEDIEPNRLDNEDLWESSEATTLSVGDLRRAREALAAASKPPEATAPETPVLGDGEAVRSAIEAIVKKLETDWRQDKKGSYPSEYEHGYETGLRHVAYAASKLPLAPAPDQTPPRGGVTVEEIALLMGREWIKAKGGDGGIVATLEDFHLFAPEDAAACLTVAETILATLSRQSADAEPSASTQPVGGVSVSVEEIDFVDALKIAEIGFQAWAAEPHNARWARKIDGTPIPNGLRVNIAEAFMNAGLARIAAPAVATEQTHALYDKLYGDSLDAIMEVIGEGSGFQRYNQGKSAMRDWFLARLRRYWNLPEPPVPASPTPVDREALGDD